MMGGDGMERIGIYGGSFNPPHIGHIRGANYAIKAFGLSKLLLIPSCSAPHKEMPANSPTPQQRAEMLNLVAGEKMEVNPIELNRGGTSYTYETVEDLAQQYPNAELVLCMGTDMFLSFLTWKEPQRILQKVSLGVLYRGDKNEQAQIAEQKKQLEAMGAKVELVENQVLSISSTQLRRLIAFNCAGEFLPAGVGDYIREKGLYTTGENWKNLPMEQLEPIVLKLLNPNRINHVLGCRDTAVELARRWGADENDAARAGILHDITKALDGPLQLTLCREYGTILDEFGYKYPKTLHALTGSLVADRIFGESPAVVDAICHHTTGKADMNLLEKIIYVADYMEPCRNFPGVEHLRELAFSDIDAALKLGLEMTLEHLKNLGDEVSPASREALEFLNKRS